MGSLPPGCPMPRPPPLFAKGPAVCLPGVGALHSPSPLGLRRCVLRLPNIMLSLRRKCPEQSFSGGVVFTEALLPSDVFLLCLSQPLLFAPRSTPTHLSGLAQAGAHGNSVQHIY